MPILVCALAGLFYFYEFAIQVSPSVMTDDLMRDLQIGAASVGFISAFFYYGYTPMQLPAGMLYDRFGPRILISIAACICASGALIFGLSQDIWMAALGRFMTGFGSSFAFIGCLVLVSRWFAPKYFALLAGVVQAMSSIGAMVGEMPFAHLVATYGWRHTMIYTSFAGYLVVILVWLIVRDSPNGKIDKQVSTGQFGHGVWHKLHNVSRHSQTWWIALYAFAIWAPIVTFAALWGVPFLMAKYGLSTPVAASMVSLIWIGIGLGSPFTGWASDRIGRRCLPLTLCGLIGAFATVAVIYVHLPVWVILIALFAFGFAASGQTLSFGVVQDTNPPRRVGTAIGLNNMCVVLGGALFQPLVGVLLHHTWHGAMQNGAPFYSVHDYQVALVMVPICYFIAFITSASKIRETHCKSQFR